MPRKRIPRAVFNQPPETGHCITIKDRPYYFIGADMGDDDALILYWFTPCSRCGDFFEEKSGLSVFWLHKRCPRHRRKQPPLEKRIADAFRTLKKFSHY